jgi:hypothetical protein
MMAETGESLKVMGSNKEIEAAGPNPGRTPTKVPIKHPKKHKTRLVGSKATLKAK